MYSSASGRLHPIWAFCLSAALSAAAFYLASVLAALVAGEHYLIFEAMFRCILGLSLLGLYSWLLATADGVEQHRLAYLGFPRCKGWLAQLGWGALLGVAMVTLAVTFAAVLSHAFEVHSRLNSHALPRIVLVLFVLIWGAVAEELMFRGYPFQHLEEGIGAAGAIFVFSILFGAVHLANPGASVWGLINTILIGVVLSIAYLRTRALWLPIGIHFGWNATLGLAIGLPVSGFRLFNVAIQSTLSGPRWLTGGSYGLEASAPGFVVVLLALAVVWKAPLKAFATREPAAEPVHQEGLPGIQS